MFDHVIWNHDPGGNIEHVEEHGITVEDVEQAAKLDGVDAQSLSRSALTLGLIRRLDERALTLSVDRVELICHHQKELLRRIVHVRFCHAQSAQRSPRKVEILINHGAQTHGLCRGQWRWGARWCGADFLRVERPMHGGQ